MRIRGISNNMIKLVVLATCFFLFAQTSVYAVDDIAALTLTKDDASRNLLVLLDTYNQACADHQEAIAARQQAEEELAALEERLVVLRGDLSTRATSMYRQGPFGVIDLLLGSTSFRDFTTTWDILRIVNDQHVLRMDEMKSLKEQQLDLVKTSTANEQKAAKLMAEIEEQTADLNAQISQMEKSIGALKEASLAEEAAIRIAQASVSTAPRPNYPVPSYLGDGAWDETILMLLRKHGLSESWLPTIRNIIWRESTNNPNANSGYYVGLCQFSPQWDPPRGWSGTGDWRFDPVANIERMVQYIADTGGLGNHWLGTNY